MKKQSTRKLNATWTLMLSSKRAPHTFLLSTVNTHHITIAPPSIPHLAPRQLSSVQLSRHRRPCRTTHSPQLRSSVHLSRHRRPCRTTHNPQLRRLRMARCIIPKLHILRKRALRRRRSSRTILRSGRAWRLRKPLLLVVRIAQLWGRLPVVVGCCVLRHLGLWVRAWGYAGSRAHCCTTCLGDYGGLSGLFGFFAADEEQDDGGYERDAYDRSDDRAGDPGF
ncbi:hypothetical protein CC80DRAFT_110151 [Byssothecium circinans]|uniref:Uncharacterized protein n=1 Tax=Byssothecium circinans TaxID=147558 RepID=A0A6A5TRU2_9PLEO|nr:hypothetical protein CC80DRAFT_110151 [Byssothecium circinans]